MFGLHWPGLAKNHYNVHLILSGFEKSYDYWNKGPFQICNGHLQIGQKKSKENDFEKEKHKTNQFLSW